MRRNEFCPYFPPYRIALLGWLLGLVACADPAVYRSDVARVNDVGRTEELIKYSLEAEMTDQNTVEDGFKWFDRHHISVYSDRKATVISEIHGGISPILTQGWWVSVSISITLHFGPDGKYLSCNVDYSESCL